MARQTPYLLRRQEGLFFRIAVPLELRSVVGSRELTRSLRTQVTHEGAPVALELAAKAKRMFYELRLLMTVDPKKLAGVVREAKLRLEVADLKEQRENDAANYAAQIKKLAASAKMDAERQRLIGENEGLKKALTHRAVEPSAIPPAASTSAPAPTAAPEGKIVPMPSPGSAAKSLLGLFENWASEKRPSPQTVDSWRSRTKAFIAFVGHDDIDRITAEDAVRWKDHLLSQRKAPGTINDGYIAALRRVCSFAIRNKRLKENPFAGVQAESPRETSRTRRKGFTDAEAMLLLQEARKLEGWHKWIPYLLAYTGCRVEEVAGAAAADIHCEDDIRFIDLHEEGRNLKNEASVRRVPLHPALIDEGFLAYVSNLPDGSPLFPDAEPDRYGKRSAGVSKILGRWIRKLGITDRRKVANHSWRHRFADLCRRAGIPRDIRFALDGHTSDDVGDSYGSGFTLPVLAAAVAKLPKQG